MRTIKFEKFDPVFIDHPEVSPLIYDRNVVLSAIDRGELRHYEITNENYQSYLVPDQFTQAIIQYIKEKGYQINISEADENEISALYKYYRYPITYSAPNTITSILCKRDGYLYQWESFKPLLNTDQITHSPFNQKKICFPSYDIICHPVYEKLVKEIKENRSQGKTVIGLSVVLKQALNHEPKIFNPVRRFSIFDPSKRRYRGLPHKVQSIINALIISMYLLELQAIKTTLMLPYICAIPLFISQYHAQESITFHKSSYFLTLIILITLALWIDFRITQSYSELTKNVVDYLIPLGPKDTSIMMKVLFISHLLFAFINSINSIIKAYIYDHPLTRANLSDVTRADSIVLQNITKLSMMIVYIVNLFQNNLKLGVAELVYLAVPMLGCLKKIQEADRLPNTHFSEITKFCVALLVGLSNYYSGLSYLNTIKNICFTFTSSFGHTAFNQTSSVTFIPKNRLFVLPEQHKLTKTDEQELPVANSNFFKNGSVNTQTN